MIAHLLGSINNQSLNGNDKLNENNNSTEGQNVEQNIESTNTPATQSSGNQLTGQVINNQGFKPAWWMGILALFIVLGILIGGIFWHKGRNSIVIHK